MMRLPDGRWTRWALGGLVAIAAFAAGHTLSRNFELEVTRTAARDPEAYKPLYEAVFGPQVEMVYIGSSRCPWSNLPQVPGLVEGAKRSLRSAAARENTGFRAVGIAMDWVPEQGIGHLAKIGHFDEISTGYNWGNTLALRYLWTDGPPVIATPQVLVFRRYVQMPHDSTQPVHYGETDRVRVLSIAGFEALAEWAEAGYPLPHSLDAPGSVPARGDGAQSAAPGRPATPADLPATTKEDP